MNARALVTLALLVIGCGDDEGLRRPPAPVAPDRVGPWAIGVTTLEVESEGRTLPVEIWYPARPGGVREEYRLVLGVLELARIESPLGAVRDAAPDASGAPYPTVVFSHGNGGVRIQSVFMTEYLASHGFVVVAPDHVGNTMAEIVNSGAALPPAEAARVRPEDVSHALDVALQASEQGASLAGMVDAARVGVAGHSFGGYTTLRIAGASFDPAAVLADCQAQGGLICKGWEAQEFPSVQRDARFTAAVAQAPGGAQAMFAGGDNGFAGVTVPTMIQGGTSDQLTPFASEQQAPFAALGGPAWLVAVEKAGHFTFSDMCLLIERVGLSVEEFEDGCGADNIPWADAHTVINRYTTAFFQAQFRPGVVPTPELESGFEPPAGIAFVQSRP